MLAVEFFNPLISTILLMVLFLIIPATIFALVQKKYRQIKERGRIEEQKVNINKRLSDIGIKTA